MQVSLESRVPFLSRELIEFAFSLSQEDYCALGWGLKGCANMHIKVLYRMIFYLEKIWNEERGIQIIL